MPIYEFLPLIFALRTIRRIVQSVTTQRTTRRMTPLNKPASLTAKGRPRRTIKLFGNERCYHGLPIMPERVEFSQDGRALKVICRYLPAPKIEFAMLATELSIPPPEEVFAANSSRSISHSPVRAWPCL